VCNQGLGDICDGRWELLGAHMYASDRKSKVRANANAMAITGYDNVYKAERVTKSSGNNLFATKLQCQLQAIYQDLVRKPVPDSLIKLLGR
jgi:hypothetical protein